MSDRVKKTKKEIVERWHKKMPKFFYWVVVITSGIVGMAFAVYKGVPAMGGELPGWFTYIYSHILTCGIAIIFICKFTVDGGFRDKTLDKHNTILEKDDC